MRVNAQRGRVPGVALRLGQGNEMLPRRARVEGEGEAQGNRVRDGRTGGAGDQIRAFEPLIHEERSLRQRGRGDQMHPGRVGGTRKSGGGEDKPRPSRHGQRLPAGEQRAFEFIIVFHRLGFTAEN